MSAHLLKRHAALGLAALIAAGCAATTPVMAPSASAGGDAGIRVESLRLSAADYMLDLRFRVTDPERAAPFFSRSAEAQLIDQASGARLVVPNTPKLGKLRQVARKDMGDRSYFMLFANPGRYLKAGSEVTLVVGDARISNLKVE
jgi:hypothetical protein